jgi:hypothetical protein
MPLDTKERLFALREKIIETGKPPSAMLFKLTDVLPTPQAVFDASQGDLNAAKALHDEVLHERIVCEIKYSKRYGGIIRLWDMGTLVSLGENDNLACAWLLAILAALTVTQTEQHS